jgi:hypothetical protein
MPAAFVNRVLSQLYLRSDAARPPLKVGLLLDSTTLPQYSRAILEDIVRSNFATLTVAVINADVSPADGRAQPAPSLRLRAALLNRALYVIYQRFVDARFRDAHHPVRPVDCADVLAGVPRLYVHPHGSANVARLPDEAIRELAGYQLDVLLRMGFKILRGGVLSVARCGVWSYHHGDNEYYRGLPPQCWEVLERNPVTGVVLQVLNEQLDGGLVLARGLYATASMLSVAKSQFGPYWSSQHFVIQKLHELHADGWDTVRARATPSPAYRGRRRIYRTPNNFEMARWAVGAVLPALARRLVRPRQVDTWSIGLRRTDTALDPEARAVIPEDFRWISTPPGHFWADPFLVEHAGQTWMMFEDYDYSLKRGAIACAPLESNGSLGPIRTVLRRPYHLSYPCVFEHDGEIFMVPEASSTERVELYRAQAFPERWVAERTLLALRAVDSTPFPAHGRWWMFTTPVVVAHSSTVTVLWSADRLDGDWRLHRAPVSADVRFARCAGRVLASGGSLYRISQDCSVRYGYAIRFNRILALDAQNYAEHPAGTMLPGELPGRVGVHTYNRCGAWEVIDGQFQVPARQVAAGRPTPALSTAAAPSPR